MYLSVGQRTILPRHLNFKKAFNASVFGTIAGAHTKLRPLLSTFISSGSKGKFPIMDVINWCLFCDCLMQVFLYCIFAAFVFFFYIYTQSKNLRYKLLYTLLKLLYNTTTTIPRGAKYNDNPEALKKEKLKRKTFKRKPDIIIKKDMDNKNKKKGGERVLQRRSAMVAAWFVAEFGKSLI